MAKKLNLGELRGRINLYRDDLVDFVCDLVKTPSVNGENPEEAVASLILKKSQDLLLPARIVAKNKKRPNVFVGEDFSSKNGILFVAHIDTVPVGDIGGWKHDPLGAEVKGGKLFGRGAIDCKVGIALSVYTLKVLKDLGYGNSASFIAVSDEESGADSDIGTKYLLSQGLMAKSAIYTYPGFDTVTIGHRGLVRVWVNVKGESAHTGSLSWQRGERGASAIEAMAKFISALSEVKMPGTNKDFPGFTFKHTATIIEGGSGESIVPDKARVLVDARLLPGHSNEKYISKIKKLAQKFSSKKVSLDIEVKTNVHGVVIPRDERIVNILVRLDREVMGIAPEVRGCGPANEGYMLVEAGIPTICGFGAGGDGSHSANEYVELDTLPKIFEIYVRAAVEHGYQ